MSNSRLPKLSLVLALVAFSLFAAWPTPVKAGPSPKSDNTKRAATAVKSLQQWYSHESGLYAAPANWWNSANAMTALADYEKATGDHSYDSIFANTFLQAQKKSRGFTNDYFDDDLWWALAWIDAYDVTGKRAYLSMAESIFATAATDAWDTSTCGGGLWWSATKKYKNAIPNELFLSTAARLAVRTQGEDAARYRDWANKEWNWFKASGMINSQNLVNDGLDSSNPAACVNNGKTAWTYNQGVIVGGLVELYRATNDSSLLTQASAIAKSAMTHLTTPKGVLQESVVSGSDAPQFKGIFVRNLVPLYRTLPKSSPAKNHLSAFIAVNAESIWSKDQDGKHDFGAHWEGPFDSADATRQTSALDVLIAALALSTDQH